MKTETQIAKENIGNRKLADEVCQRECMKSPDEKCSLSAQADYFKYLGWCQEHKASCQRFLEFLVLQREQRHITTIEAEGKITDLKQAIKLYEDNGI